ncbi:MAG: DNA-binding protein [Bacilli bacterium]|nr:DNA-binding protein [Bacilli bacterium]
MEDVVYYNELYDLYGELLTEKQRQYFEDYYFNNLSFSEMAEDYDVSRNAAFKQIHIVIEKLKEYEKILKLKQKRDQLFEILNDVPTDIRKRIEEVL